MSVYQGGLPDQGKNLYPSTEGEDPKFTPDASVGEIKTEKGGPAEFHGSSEDSGVLNSSGYHADGELRPGGIKTIDLNDVSHEA